MQTCSTVENADSITLVLAMVFRNCIGTVAIYGRPIAPMQFSSVRDRGLQSRTAGPLMRTLTLEAAALLALFLVFVSELSKWHRLHRLSSSVRKILMWTLFGVPAAALFGIDVYYQFRSSISIGQALFQFAILRLTIAVPNGLLAVGIAAVPVWAMYRLVERQFSESELISGADDRFLSSASR